jgi:RNA polymerase sigma-70 factor (ECF subfamily)
VTLSELSDAKLVTLCRERLPGDTRPFEILANRYESQVRATCYRILGDWAEAEDQTQEVFIRVWRGLPEFEGRSSFSTWLFQIAVNVSRSALAKRGRRPQIAESPVDDYESLMASSTSPEQMVLAQSDRDVLADALARLREDERLVLTLREAYEMSYQDIADHLSIGLSAAKMRVVRARMALRHAYEQLVEGDNPNEPSQ